MATADLCLFPGFDKTHSLGFARLEKSIPGRRSAGSQFWAGVLNTHFWFDPEMDTAGILMTQLTPYLDESFMEMLVHFERTVYTVISESRRR
jgi:hypothetical protein